jgi:hypothetical protein
MPCQLSCVVVAHSVLVEKCAGSSSPRQLMHLHALHEITLDVVQSGISLGSTFT